MLFGPPAPEPAGFPVVSVAELFAVLGSGLVDVHVTPSGTETRAHLALAHSLHLLLGMGLGSISLKLLALGGARLVLEGLALRLTLILGVGDGSVAFALASGQSSLVVLVPTVKLAGQGRECSLDRSL